LLSIQEIAAEFLFSHFFRAFMLQPRLGAGQDRSEKAFDIVLFIDFFGLLHLAQVSRQIFNG
jgi:hypothetical protein